MLAGSSAWLPAQSFPQRPVRLVVPFAAGGTTDIIARSIAQRLSGAWGQQVVADNRPGGAAMIAAELVSRAAPDGHTLLMGGTSFVLNTSTSFSQAPGRIDVQRDFAAIILLATGASVLAVPAASPLKTVKDLIALAKARPKQLTYGTSGVGSSNHMSGELLNLMAGISLVHVPYKGNSPSITATLGGQIDMVFAGVPTLQPMLKAGRLRAVAIGSKQRFASLPDVPTFDESGLPGYDMPSFFGLLAPARTPKALIVKINRDTERILVDQELIQQFAAEGLAPSKGSPEEFARFMRARTTQLAELIKVANIRPE